LACGICRGKPATDLERAQTSAGTVTARDWAQILANYREPNHARSVLEIVITGTSFVVLWTLM
jgi:omega-6 fatty acid desaturase (delta-12 desaturase)